ncbi:MAG: GDSL-like Lipase/Acylhydrolase [candidate division BRC1 bacterium ADurb.BinA292]|nr:MAG: GDSL-like Lipase/Acylhydrolase [candidate division BRC1 bacterium ADurb.BinA292]
MNPPDPSANPPHPSPEAPRPTRPAPARGHRFGWRARTALLLGAIALPVLLVEFGLRVVGYSHPLYPEKVQFGSPTRAEIDLYGGWDEDPTRFWLPTDYRARLQQVGRPDVAFLGCSCTMYGDYDVHLARMVADRHPGRGFSYINLGVLGWTSHQGLQQFKQDVIPLQPKVATVYFGWNDHWIGFGVEDKEVARLNESLLFKLRNVRLLQLARDAFIKLRKDPDAGYPLRVSLADYRANLREMARLAREHDIQLVLMTAPDGFVPGEEQRYAHLVPGFVASPEKLRNLIPLHEAYVEAVRDVAREEPGVILCDLAAEFGQRFSQEEISERLFTPDAIHLKSVGCQAIAEILLECLEQHGLLEEILRPAAEVTQLPGRGVP